MPMVINSQLENWCCNSEKNLKCYFWTLCVDIFQMLFHYPICKSSTCIHANSIPKQNTHHTTSKLGQVGFTSKLMVELYSKSWSNLWKQQRHHPWMQSQLHCSKDYINLHKLHGFNKIHNVNVLSLNHLDKSMQ
jgi:hypothetical protein